MREAVLDKTQLALLHVLLNGIKRDILGDLKYK